MSNRKFRIRPHSEKQKQIMMSFLSPYLREVVVVCGTKFGKALPIWHSIPTPMGWKEFGDLTEGDYVFDEHGKPTKVTFVTDTMYDHDCYEVIFSDGNKVVADAGHLWVTTTLYERKNIARAASPNDRCKSTNAKPQVRTTLDILNSLYVTIGGNSRPNHCIPLVSKPLEFETKDLPLDPYVLGAWLSDGAARAGEISAGDQPVLDEIEKAGFEVTDRKAKYNFGILNLIPILKKMNLYGNKHVPDDYLIADPSQRLALLQGFMDCDSTISKRGDCTFDNTNKNLADAVEDLAISLGIKATRTQRTGKLYGVEKKLCYRVNFTTDLPVFRLPRKKDRLRPISEKSKRRYIVGIQQVESVPVKCIRVESPTHLFLIGKGCIPTHNTLGASSAISAACWVKQNKRFRWVAPYYSQAKIGQRYIEKLLPKECFKSLNGTPPTTTVDETKSVIEYWHAQKPESFEGEGVTGGWVLDEYAKMKESVYASVRTTVSQTRAPLLILSTPKGKNHFYHRALAAKEQMEWCIKKKRQHLTHIYIQAQTEDNPFVPAETITEARKELPDRLFRQYYLAEFLDDADVFVGFRDSIVDMDPVGDTVQGGIQYWIDNDARTKDVVIGVDWGKINDYTVMGAIDYRANPPKMIGFMRFNGIDYIQAIRELVKFTFSFKAVGLINHDMTGMGQPLDDMLAQVNLPVQGVTFTNKSKADMVNQLILGFQKKEIRLPNWPEMIKELDAYEVQTTAVGNYRYAAPEGSGIHDDIVSMLMLANAALIEFSGEFSVRILEDLPNEKSKRSLNKWYSDIIVDQADSPFPFE